MIALTNKTWNVKLLLAKAKAVKQQSAAESGQEGSKEATIANTGQDKDAYTSFSTRTSSGSVGSSQDRRNDTFIPHHHDMHAISYGSSYPVKKSATTSCPDPHELRNRFQ
jgi:hypothetical protein